MDSMSFGALRAITTLSLCLVFGLARAQETEPPYADPPDRAARLSFLEGDVSLQPAGEEEWAPAIVNRPLTTGDRLWTDQDARAEVQVGQAAVRLDSNTGFSFLNVDDDTIQMQLTAGVINVHVRALTNEQIEVDTPNIAVSLLQPGNYRVEVNDQGDTTVVKVNEGEAEAIGGSQHVIVHAQQRVTFSGGEQLAARFGSLGAPDEFDSWSLEREQRDEQAGSSQTARYVSPDVTGYEDLDANGTWSSDAEYGYMWTPSHVAMDWSPYRYGRWAWIRPWGWTWIDDAPWGYAPFHYGRWAHVRNRWCWVPGPRHLRPVYAPALVGWVGTPRVYHPGSFAGVAWFPLGPREVYVPARRFSPRYVERVNVTNTMIVKRTVSEVYNNRATNVTYRNRVVPGAVTAVSRETFTSAERVGERRVGVDTQDITRAVVTAEAPQIQPVRDSRLGVSEATRRNVRVPPQTVVNRQVVVRRAPPPAAARVERSTGQINTAREQMDRSRRPQASPGTVHPARPDQPQADEIARRIQQAAQENRAQQRLQQERQQQAPEQQQQRQIEIQQRQQQNYERAARQREQQQAAAQQTQQRQRDSGRAHAERPQAERQNRPEPQKPAENKPQPQKQQDYKDQRQ
jgi:hypothetical protein